jgi:polar amino acid transport system substrate-binding protein
MEDSEPHEQSGPMRLVLLSLGMVLGIQFAVSPVSLAADLATIRQRGQLIVGIREGRQPLSFYDPVAGEWTGLEVEIARGLAAEICGNPEAIVFEPLSNEERIPAVLEDRVDVAIAGLTLTPERMRVVSFSPPYYLDGTGLLVHDSATRDLDQLQQGRIGVLQGSSAIANLRYLLPLATLVPFNRYQGAVEPLQSGQIDAFAGDITVLVGWQQDYADHHLMSVALSAEPLAIAMPKGTQHNPLRSLVSTLVTEWHDNGWLEDRATRWGLP